MNMIIIAGSATFVVLIIIAFVVCRCAIKNNKEKYKRDIQLPYHCDPSGAYGQSGTDQTTLHVRPTPPRSHPPIEFSDGLSDSDTGDDVELTNDPFVRSHSILQACPPYQRESFEHAMSDVYPINSQRSESGYDYQPTYSSQNTHRFKDIPRTASFGEATSGINMAPPIHHFNHAVSPVRSVASSFRQPTSPSRSSIPRRVAPINSGNSRGTGSGDTGSSASPPSYYPPEYEPTLPYRHNEHTYALIGNQP